MLVLCVGMYRACSTWQYGVVGQLLERHRAGVRLGFADGDGFASAVEPTLDESCWAVLKAHDAHPRFAERLARGQALGIYSHRDLRDVVFSWMHKTGLSFDELIDRRFLEHCLKNDRFWRDRPRMLLQTYEDLIADPARGVAQIARHLGIELAEGEAAEVAASLSFEANKKRTEALSEGLKAEGVEPTATDQGRYDHQSLLHWNHLRDGRAGSWRDLATPEQLATLDRICHPWLVEHGYEVDPDHPEYLAAAYRETQPRISYAQNMEDVLLDRLFRGQKGTYMDVGANHPRSNNSTYYFYQRGWRGVNVEPVPSAFDLFAAWRPEDLNLQVAVSDEDGELSFYEVAEANGLSSLSPELAEAQRARGFRVIERRVPTWTVASLVRRHGLLAPDIFSLDVEGNEEKVLRGIPLDTWRPKVFAIEATRPETNEPCHQAWEPILLDQGYLFAAFDGINRFYLRDDLANLRHHFDYPVNALDFYVKAETVEQKERADALQGQLDDQRRQAEGLHAEMIGAKVELAELKVRFGNELDNRHRDYLASLDERAGWEAERQARESERESLLSDRHALTAERDTLARRGEALEAQRDALESQRDALLAEVDHLHGVIGRLLGDVADREAEIAKATLKLRPYLKLDRLGVVPALQRKVHAHRAHTRD